MRWVLNLNLVTEIFKCYMHASTFIFTTDADFHVLCIDNCGNYCLRCHKFAVASTSHSRDKPTLPLALARQYMNTVDRSSNDFSAARQARLVFYHTVLCWAHSMAIAVPSVTRCRCRRRRRCCCGHRCAGGDTWWMAMRRAATRCGEWPKHLSNASCSTQWISAVS